jgi:hypothetical protein
VLRISRNHGAFDLGTRSSYGFEMGIVLRGKGAFYSRRPLTNDKYKAVPVKHLMTLCFSRHRSHCIVAQEDLEALHVTIPYDERRFRVPTCFRVDTASRAIVEIDALIYHHADLERRKLPAQIGVPEDLKDYIRRTFELQ